MKTYTVNETIKAIETGHLAKLSLTAEQLAALKNRDGVTALHLAVKHGCLDQIKDGVTADQLAKAVADDGMSALLYATYKGYLTQVKGGVTVAQLKAQKNPQGVTGLFLAAQEGHLHQVQGDITAAELAADQVSDHTSALLAAAFNGELFLLKGGVTSEELAVARADDGNTALHTAADSRSLDQITGGVTLQQLTAIKDAKGRTPLYWAALNGCINQIQGGVTLEQMRATLCYGNKSAFEMALENGNQDQIPGADPGGPDFTSRTEEELIELANMTCWWAQESIKKGEKKLGCRMLEKLAIDLSNHGPVCVVLTQAYMGLGNRKEGLKYACKAVKLTREIPMPGGSSAISIIFFTICQKPWPHSSKRLRSIRTPLRHWFCSRLSRAISTTILRKRRRCPAGRSWLNQPISAPGSGSPLIWKPTENPRNQTRHTPVIANLSWATKRNGSGMPRGRPWLPW